MEEIKEINPKAYDPYMEIDPQTWCKAFFKTMITCEAFENGIQTALMPFLWMLERNHYWPYLKKLGCT